MISHHKVIQWFPDNSDGHYDKMPGAFYYIHTDVEGWIEGRQVLIDCLNALAHIKFIKGVVVIGEDVGLYIDARLPAQ